MVSPLGPTLANVFLCHFEEQWISDWPIDYKSFSYRRYVGDTFLLFSFELYVTKCLNYMSSKHGNIRFTVERKEKNSLSFLDKNTFGHSGKFQTSIYRKSIFSSRLTNFESFCPYRKNIILFPLCYIVVLWFALLIKLCILKLWNFKKKFRGNGYCKNLLIVA